MRTPHDSTALVVSVLFEGFSFQIAIYCSPRYNYLNLYIQTDSIKLWTSCALVGLMRTIFSLQVEPEMAPSSMSNHGNLHIQKVCCHIRI